MNNFEFNKIHTKIIVLKWKKLLKNYKLKNLILTNQEKIFWTNLSEKRKKEFLGIRCLFKYIGVKFNIFYDKRKKKIYYQGKDQYFSISHSYERMAIGLSSYHLGVDIEKFRKNIIQIKNKFVREDEKFFIQRKYEIDYLHIIWGIKESLYKLINGIFYNFLKNYKVSPFHFNKDTYISCWILNDTHSKKFYAFYRKIKNYYLVYSIDL